jgi:hypothetical protein
VILALALVLTALVGWAEQPDTRRAVMVGAACSVAILARLDLAMVIGIVPLAMVVRSRSWRPAAGWLGGAAVVGVPFAAWFVVRYHHVLTVSATIKQREMAATIDERFGGRLSSGFARYWLDLAGSYRRSLTNPAFETVATAGSGLATLVTVAIAAVGSVGAVVGYRARFHPSGPVGPEGSRRPASPCGFALWVLAAVVIAKALFDLTNVPTWAGAWYSAPQHLAVPFAIGAFAWLGAAWLLGHRRPLGMAAVAVVVVACVPLGSFRLTSTAGTAMTTGGWQDQIELAADWIRQDGPAGRYGARDAGLLGFRLDGEVDVVNLDGLVNDYAFADYVATGPTTLERARQQGVDHFVGRVRDEDMAGQFRCADVLWTSPDPIAYGDGLSSAVTSAHLYVLDLNPCTP